MQINQSVKVLGGADEGLVGVVSSIESDGTLQVSFQVNEIQLEGQKTQLQDGGVWVEYIGIYLLEELKAL